MTTSYIPASLLKILFSNPQSISNVFHSKITALYRVIFPRCKFPEFPKWAHNSGNFILGCCIKFDYGSLAELGRTITCCIQCRTLQQNTFTTFAAVNVELATMLVMNGFSIQTQVYRHIATPSSYSYSYSVQRLR